MKMSFFGRLVRRIKLKLVNMLSSRVLNALRYLKYHITRISFNAGCAAKKNSADLVDFEYVAEGYSEDKEWASAFFYYQNKSSGLDRILLKWSDRPSPGNFGDWLSPYIISKVSSAPVDHLDEVSNIKKKHMIAIGSIASLANEYSFVLGAGVNSRSAHLGKANYYSLRGPLTNKVAKDSLGINVSNMGDLGFLIARYYRGKSGFSRNKVLFAPHINHIHWANNLSCKYPVLNIHSSHPSHIEHIIDQLLSSDLVITSAMHILITCQSYGVPCILVNLNEISGDIVPGDGVKYIDAQEGIGLPALLPRVIKSEDEFFYCIESRFGISDTPERYAIDNLMAVAQEGVSEYFKWSKK